ncbi:hypothetical protein GCM10028824_41420 [Hymenobacter segetis]
MSVSARTAGPWAAHRAGRTETNSVKSTALKDHNSNRKVIDGGVIQVVVGVRLRVR